MGFAQLFPHAPRDRCVLAVHGGRLLQQPGQVVDGGRQVQHLQARFANRQPDLVEDQRIFVGREFRREFVVAADDLVPIGFLLLWSAVGFPAAGHGPVREPSAAGRR